VSTAPASRRKLPLVFAEAHLQVPGGSHLMHLESGRALLYNAVNAFLTRSAQ